MNDRQRCEVSFLGRVIHLVILGGLQTKTDQQHKDLCDLAYMAAAEPFNGLTIEHQAKLKRRVNRMTKVTIEPLTGKTHGLTLVLIAYYFINSLVDNDYLAVPEGSKLATIVDYLLSLIDTDKAEVKERMIEAEERACKWLCLLKKGGYYDR